MYLNKIYILGNLTQNPELKTLPTGNKVCTFSVATNRTWKDAATGQKKDAVEFHSIVTYGRQAEICGQYLQKGSQLLVEGRVQTRSWDDTDGKKRYRTEVIAENIQLGNRPQGGSAPRDFGSDNQIPQTDEPKQAAPAMDAIEYPADVDLEDIPF
ncbi:MAG TPA: single-stranded DNA-binding protein [Candidatus Paceibacterota bacterium]